MSVNDNANRYQIDSFHRLVLALGRIKMSEEKKSHTNTTLDLTKEFIGDPRGDCRPGKLTLDGSSLSISMLTRAAENPPVKIAIDEAVLDKVNKNHQFLADQISQGKVIYGVNTGYGGSADVRSNDFTEMQKSLIRHLNAGFGAKAESTVVRAVMIVRANSLCRAHSGVRPEIIQVIISMLREEIIPVVPLRGSVSASGDLMPTSYIAASMMGRPDSEISYKGRIMNVVDAFKESGLTPVVFQAKEALAVVNSASFASSLAAFNAFDANHVALLTQLATAMTVESLKGRMESYHPTIHKLMPHPGQQEAAANILDLLSESRLAVSELDMNLADQGGRLKQDRYAIRSAPQWLGPVLETLLESSRRITTEINSVSDNPIIDDINGEILHGANFQGTSITVAMDQTRQALQLCGKLLFAQMSEMVNHKYSEGLPPNLNGSDVTTDFGFKGTDTAMAAYCSELDHLTNPVTSHVLSAEMHNQSVNSLALLSARLTSQAVELVLMMLANIFLAQAQAIDLRWLQSKIQKEVAAQVTRFGLEQHPGMSGAIWPWYNFAFAPEITWGSFFDQMVQNTVDRAEFVKTMTGRTQRHLEGLTRGEATEEIMSYLGKGSDTQVWQTWEKK